MRTLAASLTNIVGRPVVDMTDLAGAYDYTLTFTPDTRPAARRGSEPPESVPDAPSIFTALQEQLGLRLERQRGLVDVVIIRPHSATKRRLIERPRSNQFSVGRSMRSIARISTGPRVGWSLRPSCSCMAVKSDGPSVPTPACSSLQA